MHELMHASTLCARITHRPSPPATRSVYWERILNTTGEAEARSQAACTLMPSARSAGAISGLLVHGGFGKMNESDKEGSRLSSARHLSLGDGKGSWHWSTLRMSGTPCPARLGHRVHAANDSFAVFFGGSLEGGKFLNDVCIGHEYKLRSQHEGHDDVDDDDDGGAEAAGMSAPAEQVTLRTVRTSDAKKKRAKRRKKKRKGRSADEEGSAPKEEL